MPDGRAWPKVSIVTPSFNQAPYLEETIRSVLGQGYQNLEYLIIDGGSTDGSQEIIKRYADRLAYWVSERDRGQTHAVRKGFDRAQGEILAWVNSDDLLLPGAVATAARVLSRQGSGAAYGNRLRLDTSGVFFDFDIAPARLRRWRFLVGSWVPQETLFMWREAYERVGGLDERLQFALDYDLILKMVVGGVPLVHTGRFMGVMRFHDEAKSTRIADVGRREFFEVMGRHLLGRPLSRPMRALVKQTLERASFHSYQLRKKIACWSGDVTRVFPEGFVPADPEIRRRLVSATARQ
jgi:glycosyltransferase involved in cell wall biosynthesis